ncbi:MAG: hypothetical protein AB7G17_05160 [Phycisphaerales bacterium]
MIRSALSVRCLAACCIALACAAPNTLAEPPRELGDILHAATAVSTDELAMLAGYLNAPYYFVVPHGQNVTLLEGSRVIRLGARFGEEPERNKPLVREILWNAGPEFVNFRLDDDPEVLALDPGAMIVIGSAHAMSDQEREKQRRIDELHAHITDAPDAAGCSVTCGPGYFACCTYGKAPGVRPSCVCRARSHLGTCDSGGEGSSECTLAVN